MCGLADCVPAVSRQTVTMLTPLGAISSCSVCQPGRSLAQPHHGAHERITVRDPRTSPSRTESPSKFCSSMSGTSTESTTVPARNDGPSAASSLLCLTNGMPNRSDTTCADIGPGGSGMHTSPLHAPSGFTTQPVLAVSSAESIGSAPVTSMVWTVAEILRGSLSHSSTHSSKLREDRSPRLTQWRKLSDLLEFH